VCGERLLLLQARAQASVTGHPSRRPLTGERPRSRPLPFRSQSPFSPGSKPPQNNLSNRGEPLRLNDKTHERGVGVHAPSRIAYDIDPKWASFVALAGIDENIIETSNGSDLGCISSVVFRVFIDGELAAESPVMRFMLPPWRFDVEIPRGAETIALVVQPTEYGNREDVADWVEAGFVRRDGKTKAVRR
jgi:hypothetical protein